jgi:hypothetical protein
MDRPFNTDAQVPRPALATACRCPLHGRRLFTGGLLGAGLAAGAAGWRRRRIPECKRSTFTKAVSARAGRAAGRPAVPPDAAEGQRRARAGAGRPPAAAAPEVHQRAHRAVHARLQRPRAAGWKWEVNLIGSRQINAFCMPGGKIAFYYGILAELQLSDDEVAMIMGHEAAHALLEHAREQMGKNVVTTGALRLGAALLGLGSWATWARRSAASCCR